MDIPRRRPRRWWRAAILGGALAVAVSLGYGALKRGAVDALELGASAGVAWLQSTAQSPPGPRGSRGARPGASELVELPSSYREWVFVGSATGLAYGEPQEANQHGAFGSGDRRSGDGSPGTFTHVYLEPGAYQHFLHTGEFMEGTAFVLEMRRPATGVSIARGGWFAGDLNGVHAAIKNTDSFGGWAYFDVDAAGLGRRVSTPACATCHSEHGALDNVFVQFYPALTEAMRATRR